MLEFESGLAAYRTDRVGTAIAQLFAAKAAENSRRFIELVMPRGNQGGGNRNRNSEGEFTSGNSGGSRSSSGGNQGGGNSSRSEAARKGGESHSKQHMKEIGRKGGQN